MKTSFKIRTKMLLLFSVIPLILLAALGLFYVQQINSLTSLLNDEGEQIVRALAEDAIRQKSQSVAVELDRYIKDHPEIAKEDFQTHPVLRSIAEQSIGLTGYSVVLEAPFNAGDAKNVFWTHPNEKLIALEFAKLKKPLGENYDGTAKIIEEVITNGTDQSQGYYKWLEKDGSLNDKYMVITRVGKTPFIVAATTYISEFTEPMTLLEERSDKIISRIKTIVIAAIISVMIILALIVTVYGNRVSKKISSLSLVAERISRGDLNIKIQGRSDGDEIGALAQSIERLRTSVKIMYRRLQKPAS